MKLNQLLAILQSAKSSAEKGKTAAYQKAQKESLFQGIARVYQPKDEEGHVYPAEYQPVTYQASDLIAEFREAAKEFMDLAATQDLANTEAKADVVVDGQTILADMPVTNLLFLEKQLVDIRTFLQSLPILPATQEWLFDPNRGCYVSSPKQTTKTKKVTEFVVAYDATEHHPAQIKEVTNDVVEGTWTATSLSGALPHNKVSDMLKRLDKLMKAVVTAREEANSMSVTQKVVADSVFSYIFD